MRMYCTFTVYVATPYKNRKFKSKSKSNRQGQELNQDTTTAKKFCKKCQADTERQGRGCKPCGKAATAAWQAVNKERIRARQASPKNKALKKAYTVANKEALDEVSKAWRLANLDRVKANARAWRKANADKCRKYSAAWDKANPEATRIKNQNRRSRKRENGGVLSKGLSAKLFKLQKGKCPCCNQPLGSDFHLDHIVPLVLGGDNTDSNIQLLRSTCNHQKHSKDPIIFMQSKGFLL